MLNPILITSNTTQMCSLHDPNQTPAVVLVLTSFVTGSDLTGQQGCIFCWKVVTKGHHLKFLCGRYKEGMVEGISSPSFFLQPSTFQSFDLPPFPPSDLPTFPPSNLPTFPPSDLTTFLFSDLDTFLPSNLRTFRKKCRKVRLKGKKIF